MTLLRAVAVAVLVLLLLPLGASAALAHSGGLEPSASLPRILAVEPQVTGLTVTVIEAGARLRIDNATSDFVDVVPPPGVPRGVEPVVAPGTTARWAEPRIAPDAGPIWMLVLRVGDRDVTVRGDRLVPPPPATAVWWLLTALAAALVALLGRRLPSRAPTLVVATSLVVAAYAVHILGAALVPEGQPFIWVALGAAGLGLAAWGFGITGVALTLGGRQFGPLLCALAGAMLAMITAADTSSFGNAVLPFAWSPVLDRATTVLTVGAGAGLFVTGFAVLRDLTPARRTPPVENEIVVIEKPI